MTTDDGVSIGDAIIDSRSNLSPSCQRRRPTTFRSSSLLLSGVRMSLLARGRSAGNPAWSRSPVRAGPARRDSRCDSPRICFRTLPMVCSWCRWHRCSTPRVWDGPLRTRWASPSVRAWRRSDASWSSSSRNGWCCCWTTLSPREAEVLHLLASGATNRAIAEALVVSVPTVERHLTHIYGKIGVRGRAEAAVFAVRRGAEGAV